MNVGVEELIFIQGKTFIIVFLILLNQKKDICEFKKN